MAVAISDLLKQFQDEAGQAGATVHLASAENEVISLVLNLVREHNVRHVVMSGSPVADTCALKESLVEAGIEVINSALRARPPDTCEARVMTDKLKQKYLEADLGICEASAAIAETGTLIITGNEGDERLVSILPRIHITLLNVDNVVNTMEEVVKKLKSSCPAISGRRFPRYVTYLTGRNTTGDIPGALTARAQGPEQEYIVVLSKDTVGRSA
jgi:L-lactate dehydrogenase complex protein LldF